MRQATCGSFSAARAGFPRTSSSNANDVVLMMRPIALCGAQEAYAGHLFSDHYKRASAVTAQMLDGQGFLLRPEQVTAAEGHSASRRPGNAGRAQATVVSGPIDHRMSRRRIRPCG